MPNTTQESFLGGGGVKRRFPLRVGSVASLLTTVFFFFFSAEGRSANSRSQSYLDLRNLNAGPQKQLGAEERQHGRLVATHILELGDGALRQIKGAGDAEDPRHGLGR